MKRETEEFIKEAKARGSVLGLANMKYLMERLGNVQERLPIIHIAGTNGKGSVGAYLASIFREAGLTVGRYTSPAVFDPLEVFTLNDESMTQDQYEVLAERVRLTCTDGAFREDQLPTIFELETATAFLWFDERKPDLVLLECGMGGSEDATNVFSKPLASVITSISLDHTAILGDTLEKIAAVKAGIIKEGCPVFSAPQEEGVEEVLRQRAREKDSDLILVGRDRLKPQLEQRGRLLFQYEIGNFQMGLETRLTGHYQMVNAALAAEVAFRLLPSFGVRPQRLPLIISEGIYRAAWPGRFETIHRDPLILIDGAHNPGAALELKRTIRACLGEEARPIFILGVLGDKDHRQMLEILLPLAGAVVTLTPHNPRALAGEKLAEEAKEILTLLGREKKVEAMPPLMTADSTEAALSLACSLAKSLKLPILACGSLSYLGELKEKVGLQFGQSVL